jgi:5'-3' exonuclease/20S proteasome alpha/beta subunit
MAIPVMVEKPSNRIRDSSVAHYVCRCPHRPPIAPTIRDKKASASPSFTIQQQQQRSKEGASTVVEYYKQQTDTMGVPKFYRWISERYPLITQRHGVSPGADLAREHRDGSPPPAFIPAPDPLSTAGLPPAIDRLYLDMNGIIHGCSHNNQPPPPASTGGSNSETDDGPDENARSPISEAEIFANIRYYLDRLVHEIAQPRQLLYIAIDGVAPRAKLNQQRARRYRASQEGEIEQTVYDAHRRLLIQEEEEQQRRAAAEDGDYESLQSDFPSSSSSVSASASLSLDKTTTSGIREVEPGRFTGKFQTRSPSESAADGDTTSASDLDNNEAGQFHSNFITPGTPFFARCTAAIEEFLHTKMATDPAWQDLTVIFSSSNVPGEGEHKIMQFMREQKARPDYDPNLRHCIMGQDGDLIMLGLATHEPNLVLLREQVMFDKKRRAIETLAKTHGLDLYLYNANFEFLHMNVLRDYLALELETSNVVPDSPFDVERTVDDFVFLTFFVGNDFLPHMPALDIGDEALDLLLYTYRVIRQQWQEAHMANPGQVPPPYLTQAGEIVSGQRLEEFLRHVGRHESNYYAYKGATTDYEDLRKTEAKFGHVSTPSDQVLQAKEVADRSKYRELIHKAVQRTASENAADFSPVMASRVATSTVSEDTDAEEQGLTTRMGSLLQYSVGTGNPNDDYDSRQDSSLVIDETDFKGRYYADKFGFSPFDADKHLALRKTYVEGLIWNLRYYYQSHEKLSWEWFYPYHYGPMISDLVGLDNLIADVSFDGRLGGPLRPFEQLLACLPASQARLLPTPFQKLMTEEDSPIRDFYPVSFTVDMNGKRWPWEAVVLLPFIDSGRLRESVAAIDIAALSPEDIQRNQFMDTVVLQNTSGEVTCVPFPQSEWALVESKEVDPCFRPVLDKNTEYPLDGLPTLRDGSVHSMSRRRIRVNVHGNLSRYQTAVLEIANEIPDLVPLDTLASLIGTTVYINYPSLIASFVTAVSNAKEFRRGNDAPKLWNTGEASLRQERVNKIIHSYKKGLGMTGTGGIVLPGGDDNKADAETLLSVRPMQGLKTLPDGTVVKTFANYEIEVPLFVLSWAPVQEDKRLKNLPMQLEKDPYHLNRVLSNGAKGRFSSGGAARNTTLARAISDSPSDFGIKRGRSHRGFSSWAPFVSQNQSFLSRTTPSTPASLANRRNTRGEAIAWPKWQRGSYTTRGRFFTAGVMLLAVFAGVKPVHGTSSPTTQIDWRSPTLSVNSHRGVDLYPQSDLNESEQRTTAPLEFAHGTTTLSFKYQGGIIAAVDSRASLGNFIGSKTTQKVLPVNRCILGTMAGGAADCMFWIRKLAAEAALHEVSEGRRMSVARASRLLANDLYSCRGQRLSMGTMIMGFDDDRMSLPRIFYVDDTGMRLEGDSFTVGSGSTYAQGILDSDHRFDMTDQEAIALGIKAIRHATFRDAGSGGFINVYLIKRDGWVHVFRQDLASFPTELSEA